MTKKDMFVVLSSVVTLIFSIIIVGTILCGILYNVLFERESHLPDPNVIYGEFPFELTYMINGKIITINDVYVCEYVGAYWNVNQGHYRKWKGNLKSNQKEHPVLITDGNKEIICTVGNPEYYMNDQRITQIQKYNPTLVIVEYLESGGTSSGVLSDELKEYYNIELVNWKLSEPIEQSFG